MSERNYYREAGEIHWRLQTWGSALRLLQAAQIELDAARAALAALTARAEAAEAEQTRLEAKIVEVTADCNSNAANAYAAIKRAEEAEAQLAAVPVDELRRWKEHSSVGSEVSAMRYDRDKAWRDHDAIRYWLDGCEDDGVPPAATFKPEVQP